MELYSGGTMGDRQKREGRLPVAVVLDTGVKIAGALQTAHDRGLLHRDIKPQNLFISEFGEPALGDFGISTLDDERSISGGGGLTVHYAPPEVLEGATATAISDVYSFAATLYTLLEGARPFAPTAGRDSRSASWPAGSCSSRRRGHERDDVPRALSELLARTMSKAPDERPVSAAEFGQELQRIQGELGLPVTALPLAAPPPRRRARADRPRAGPGEAPAAAPPAAAPAGAGRPQPTRADRATVRSRSGRSAWTGLTRTGTRSPSAGRWCGRRGRTAADRRRVERGEHPADRDRHRGRGGVPARRGRVAVRLRPWRGRWRRDDAAGSDDDPSRRAASADAAGGDGRCVGPGTASRSWWRGRRSASPTAASPTRFASRTRAGRWSTPTPSRSRVDGVGPRARRATRCFVVTISAGGQIQRERPSPSVSLQRAGVTCRSTGWTVPPHRGGLGRCVS